MWFWMWQYMNQHKKPKKSVSVNINGLNLESHDSHKTFESYGMKPSAKKIKNSTQFNWDLKKFAQ